MRKMKNEVTPRSAPKKQCLADVDLGIFYRPASDCDYSPDVLAVVNMGPIIGDPIRYNVLWIYADNTMPASMKKARCEEIIVEEFRAGEKLTLEFED